MRRQYFWVVVVTFKVGNRVSDDGDGSRARVEVVCGRSVAAGEPVVDAPVVRGNHHASRHVPSATREAHGDERGGAMKWGWIGKRSKAREHLVLPHLSKKMEAGVHARVFTTRCPIRPSPRGRGSPTSGQGVQDPVENIALGCVGVSSRMDTIRSSEWRRLALLRHVCATCPLLLRSWLPSLSLLRSPCRWRWR